MSSTRRRSGLKFNAPTDPPNLLIAGASARAAAWSAVRGGWQPATADLFADSDLSEIAEATRIHDWPEEILSWTRRFGGDMPLVYVGGLENHSALLDSLSRQRPVAGLTGPLLDELRDPAALNEWCTDIGFRRPRISNVNDALPSKVLVKRSSSASGLGIHFWDGKPLEPGEYLQELIAGRSVSAAYLLSDNGAELLGTFYQFPPQIEASSTLPPFLYRGSISCTLPYQRRLEELGSQLHALGVRGLCGVDFIETEDGEVVLLEVNPRYTASMELIERQTGRSLISEHLACFGFATGGTPVKSDIETDLVPWAKRIVFARRSIVWSNPPAKIVPPLPGGQRAIADVPLEGTRIAAGEPVCTLFFERREIRDERREIKDERLEARDEGVIGELLQRERELLGFLETTD